MNTLNSWFVQLFLLKICLYVEVTHRIGKVGHCNNELPACPRENQWITTTTSTLFSSCQDQTQVQHTLRYKYLLNIYCTVCLFLVFYTASYGWEWLERDCVPSTCTQMNHWSNFRGICYIHHLPPTNNTNAQQRIRQERERKAKASFQNLSAIFVSVATTQQQT